jgi:hypothetical protein
MQFSDYLFSMAYLDMDSYYLVPAGIFGNLTAELFRRQVEFGSTPEITYGGATTVLPTGKGVWADAEYCQ